MKYLILYYNDIFIVLASDVVYAILVQGNPCYNPRSIGVDNFRWCAPATGQGRKTKERTCEARKKKGAQGVPEF